MVTEELKKEFERIYGIYRDNKDEMVEMNAGVNDQVKVLAKSLNVKPGVIMKTFSYKYTKARKGEDFILNIQQVLEEVGDKE